MRKLLLPFMLVCLALSATPVKAEDDVVAKVNGVGITQRDIEAEVDRAIPRSTYHGSLSEEKRNEFREKALEELINRELQYQDAVASGMKPDKKQVKERMKKIRDRFDSKKAYKKALEQSGLTEDQLKERVEKAVVVQAMVEKTVTVPARMTDEALKDYYEKNISKFKQPEGVRLRIISVRDEKKAADALARVQDGENFGTVAATMSEDNYRIMGGDIGYIHRGRILPELEDAAFKLEVGNVSGLILADEMWYIIKVEDKKPEHQLTFEETSEKLKKDLEAKRTKDITEKWIADLRAKAKIEIVRKKEGTEQNGQAAEDAKQPAGNR